MSPNERRSSKESILQAYRDLVIEKGGTVVGGDVFARECGVSPYYWKGGYWRSWSAFQQEAGFAPNIPTQRIDDEKLLRGFAQLALELGRLPTEPDLKLKKASDPSFPGVLAFRRWGDRNALLTKVAEYCEGKEHLTRVFQLIRPRVSGNVDRRTESLGIKGFVYLLRSGKHYKIGRSNAVGRRLRELAIQLPKKPHTVHVIETDDPEGIEAYWHSRFAEKRGDGEWFDLSPEDVRAFKRRR